MKKYYRVTWILIVSVVLISACKDLDFNYRQFVEQGETIYIGKADSVQVRGGNHRVEVSWLLLSDPKVHSYKLYWNNNRDSTSAEVTKTAQVDTVRVLLNDMREGMHHFEIRMFDAEGHRSVPARVSGRVYGDQYNKFLVNRTFTSAVIINETDLEIEWVEAEDQLLFSQVSYTNTDGEEIKHIVAQEAETDTLKKFPSEGIMTLVSAFKPDSLALDTFYSPTETISPFDFN